MRDSQTEALAAQAEQLLGRVRGQALAPIELGERSVELARILFCLAERFKTPRDLEQAQVLAGMMQDPRGQVFTTLLADRAYRSRSRKRTVEQARYLLERLGAPKYLGALDRLSLAALRRLGTWLPSLSGTAMLNHIRQETTAFILPAADEQLSEYIRLRREAGVRVNINHLGEAVLGEEEAKRRVAGYVELLGSPQVDTISVKISSIFSQLQPLSFDRSVERIAERLRTIYRAAISHPGQDQKPKLVTLDMESYRDLPLTVAAFEQVLDEPEFLQLRAGLVLQAYLPDSDGWQARVFEWAKRRVGRGGSAIRVRIVKGANLALERVESELRGWPSPIYASKAEVDANYKRLTLRACQPENIACAELGIASHNLFDLCFGLVASASLETTQRTCFELLEGMANPEVCALAFIGVNVLVYAPIVFDHEFPSAIAYLTRRLDENTSAQNYLAQSFAMQLDSAEWQSEAARFQRACADSTTVSSAPRRTQDRAALAPAVDVHATFQNEPDTDFGLAANRAYVQHWLSRVEALEFSVASRIGGSALGSVEVLPGFDPSRPGHVPYSIHLAGPQAIEQCLACAVLAQRSGGYDDEQRRHWLSQAARALRAARGELIALMVLDAGKRAEEADVEVSEAIDFAEYYLRCHRELSSDSRVRVSARGVVVVTPPWNFPLAIALGGVFAALVAGNAVILKPALETPLVAQRACELLWDAGIPQSLLQYVVCQDEVGSQLISDPRTSSVVLTGATSTARLFHRLRPDLHLLAETGGKNALIVSAMSDREQAIQDVLASAFGHAGQKCSALSQLILEREVYRDPGFLSCLEDAARSLEVGSAWQLDSFVTPMIAPPSELQRKALTELGPGESWLVEPRFDAKNPRLVSPGIKLGVVPGSPSHRTEFFCPLLSVLEATDIRQAVALANDTPYGLTAGIHSLDEREQQYFIEHMAAGNLYVNRKITGAIVRRQAFGGWKESSFGSGAKAGGPNYVTQFVHVQPASASAVGAADAADATDAAFARHGIFADAQLPAGVLDLLRLTRGVLPGEALEAAATEFLAAHTRWFASACDESQLRGEDNLLGYLPLAGLFVIADADMSEQELALIVLAAAVTDCPWVLVSAHSSPARPLALALGASLLGHGPDEEEDALCAALETTSAERVRCRAPLSARSLEIARKRGLHVLTAAPTVGRYELLHTLREQSVSVSYHRYGHLGLRGLAAG
jgi:RHH-type transcriptional regulator, proline utilization regulon repressor / proline dehydrogenase / delta 1-pyrroline-5-carboxylate dehydrogenase